MNSDAENSRPQAPKHYLTKAEFAIYSGLSLATVQRLKDQRKIHFHQPSGKGGRLLFPRDALERTQSTSVVDPMRKGKPRLSGPRPLWQSQET